MDREDVRMGSRTVILLAEQYDSHEDHRLGTPIIQVLEFVIAAENTRGSIVGVSGGYGIS